MNLVVSSSLVIYYSWLTFKGLADNIFSECTENAILIDLKTWSHNLHEKKVFCISLVW